MSFDVFAALAHPGSDITIHNVQLIDVRPAEDGHELLTIEYAGTTRELIGGGRWSEEYSRRKLGKFGYLVSAHPSGDEVPAGACYFRDYIDQSLRRVPELDTANRSGARDGRVSEFVGWCCDARPGGFYAPVGIIPGEAGRFVPDGTVPVTLRVPPEFVRECRRVQMTPEELLRSFVGDLAGIQNFSASPRADGYGSNGSDEREYAGAWLRRAHGMNAIDIDALEDRDTEEMDKDLQRDDFVSLLDEFESHGGKADDLVAAVRALIEKQAKSSWCPVP